MEIDARARNVTQYLFTNGSGNQAARLVLMDRLGRDLGGWRQQAVVDHITQALLAARRDAFEEAAKIAEEMGKKNRIRNLVATEIAAAIREAGEGSG